MMKNNDILNENEFDSNLNHQDVIIPVNEVDKPSSNPSGRLISLDALRGLSIILMITANYQTEHAFPQIEHAEWSGFTIADAVFPTFLFAMGISIPLAVGKLSLSPSLLFKIIKRSCILWLIGAFLNGFPFTLDHHSYRIAGVLQRLGLCYLVTSLLFVFCRGHSKLQRFYLYLGFPLGALIIWFSVTYGLYVPDCGYGHLTPECSAEGYVDTSFWGENRNYMAAKFDPEGVLSSFTACITTWMGLMTGIHIVKLRPTLKKDIGRYQIASQFTVLSLILMFFSYALHTFLPIIKSLWTPTFVLLAGGCSLATLGVLIYLFDILHFSTSRHFFPRGPSRCLIAIGRNPLLTYVLSELVIASFYTITLSWSGAHQEDGVATLWLVIYDTIAYSWLPSNVASLFLSQLYIWLIFVPLGLLLDKKGMYLKV